MTKAIQLLVFCLADADEMPQGLKMVNKDNTIFYNSVWRARVDYDQALQENNKNNKQDQESQVNQDNNKYNEMHPDIIVRLAQDKYQANLHQDQENQEQEPLIKQEPLIEENEKEEIVFEE
jgi:hypothetical protein